jgi:hypothetical protein
MQLCNDSVTAFVDTGVLFVLLGTCHIFRDKVLSLLHLMSLRIKGNLPRGCGP